MGPKLLITKFGFKEYALTLENGNNSHLKVELELALVGSGRWGWMIHDFAEHVYTR